MKNIVFGFFVMIVFMLFGCNNVAISNISNTTNTNTYADETDANETYTDETHKEIQYGELSFSFDDYHITSKSSSDNSLTFVCELDAGYQWSETDMIITVQEIEKQNFPEIESVISYINDLYKNYESLEIYDDLTDESGIISLYIVTKGELTYYIVYYKDVGYLIESNYSVLEIYLFKGFTKINYEINNREIACADSAIAYIHEMSSYVDNEVKYEMIQGRDGTEYSACLNLDEDYQYTFTFMSKNGEIIFNLSGRAGYISDIITFLDVNMDGYADIQVLEEEGTLNNSYALYLWDPDAQNFVKVICDEMLSDIQVYDGYLLNWAKDDPQSGIIQKFIWNRNVLIKESEEQYHTD